MGKRGPKRDFRRGDILRTIRAREDQREPWTTTELADELGCSHSLAYNRLRVLTDMGLVESKKVGGNSRVWWIPTASDTRVNDLLLET